MLCAHPSHRFSICLSCASIPRVCDLVCARDALRRLWSGAYSKAEKYSRADVKALVEYGRERGVKIMIEFDMPGEFYNVVCVVASVAPEFQSPPPLIGIVMW
jgi:N-acetyl-beta-hexosaminidase